MHSHVCTSVTPRVLQLVCNMLLLGLLFIDLSLLGEVKIELMKPSRTMITVLSKKEKRKKELRLLILVN
jgi:uncharacterized membrane protein YesL